MTKDFDIDRDLWLNADRNREFNLAGQTFTGRVGIRAEILTRYLSATSSVDQELMEALDALFKAFLDQDSYQRLLELRQQDADPLTIRDLTGVAAWIVSEETARPTAASSASTAGREQTTATSTGDSRSQATTEPPAPLSAVS